VVHGLIARCSRCLTGTDLAAERHSLVLCKLEWDVREPGEHNGTFCGVSPAFVLMPPLVVSEAGAERGLTIPDRSVGDVLAEISPTAPGSPGR
jgi:hypothetical protein